MNGAGSPPSSPMRSLRPRTAPPLRVLPPCPHPWPPLTGPRGDGTAAATGCPPVIVASEGISAATLGAVLRDELHFQGDLVTLDGLELGDLDYIDVGTPVAPSGVVPVIVKSLVFPEEH